MKEFNLEEAKAGKAVCTRDGRKARILCFDLKYDDYPICAAIENKDGIEDPLTFTLDGRAYRGEEDDEDLMMASEKHEGWVNVVRFANGVTYTGSVFETEEEALAARTISDSCISTCKIVWEE